MDHTTAIAFILSEETSLILSGFAFLLFFLYILHGYIFSISGQVEIRRYGVYVRAMNWLTFGIVFLLFGKVVPLKDLDTWRATARMALFFLMLSESAYEISILYPHIKRKLWNWTQQRF